MSCARQELTGAALAPKNGATLGELRHQRPQTQLREIPPAGGCSNEMLRVCLDDPEILSLLCDAAEDFARGEIPDNVTRCLMLATMTALEKRDGGVRGIATGTSFRRLVAKVLARQFSEQVEQACAPFQFPLSTRAGTDCVGHAIRVATELNTRLTVLSIDGVGLFDHVLRAAMLSKVAEVPSLRELLPFVRAAYARPNSYVWVDEEEGVRHTIEQHEGGEQGDPHAVALQSGHPRRVRGDSTYTSCVHPNGLVCCTIYSTQRCKNEQVSGCTRARHACGISQENALSTWRILDQMCGTPKVSRSWEPLWGLLSFCLSSSSGWSKSENCGTPSLPDLQCAAPPPMRRSALPPLIADRAPQSIIQVRARA